MAVVKLRGLPWHVKEQEIADFFQPLPVGPESVTLISQADGRFSGIAFVWVHEENLNQAAEYNRRCIGHRYVEVFKSTEQEYTAAVQGMQQGAPAPIGRSGHFGVAYAGQTQLPPARAPAVAPQSMGGMGMGMGMGGMGGMGSVGGVGMGAHGHGHGRPQFGHTSLGGPSLGMGGGGGIAQPMGGQSADRQQHLPPVPADGVLRARGMPFSSTAAELAEIFHSFGVDESMVFLKCHTGGARAGEMNGDAYIRFPSADLATQALQQKQKCPMGTRYVELFIASEAEIQQQGSIGAIVGQQADPQKMGMGADGFAGTVDLNPQENRPNSGWIRLRGLPFSATQFDVVKFFGDQFPLTEADVTIKYGTDGRPSGEAFVQLESEDMASQAQQQLDRTSMGGRYIEVFTTTYHETLKTRTNRPSPYQRPGSGGSAQFGAAPQMGVGYASYGTSQAQFQTMF